MPTPSRPACDNNQSLSASKSGDAPVGSRRSSRSVFRIRTVGTHCPCFLGIVRNLQRPARAGRLPLHEDGCFCFQENILKACDTMEATVMLFIDPAIANDPGMTDVHGITLSYVLPGEER
ncbi:cytochrome c oxidase assembly protein [Microvirga sp. ACRRW]|uniref:cytochrome c oxidase assembly protein n=1 Tax=Microvirga sp. ACRRW TaxID=2918205 RepID=UPI00351D6788